MTELKGTLSQVNLLVVYILLQKGHPLQKGPGTKTTDKQIFKVEMRKAEQTSNVKKTFHTLQSVIILCVFV